MRWIPFLLLLSACASPPTADLASTPVTADGESPPSGVTTAPVAADSVAVATPELKEKAAQFDRFLWKKIAKKEEKELRDSCERDPSPNPFCYSVIHYDELQSKLRGRGERRPRPARVRPRFVKNEIANWDELRADTIGHLVRAFNRTSKANADIIKDYALKETQCPNNAAVAIAAALEDRLPDDVDAAELAQLYEKGGDCLTDPDDRENILTRAGLFYYHKKDYARAAAVWKRSCEITAAKSPRPFFWLHRVLTEQKDKSGAQAALETLKERFPFSFHTVVARLKEGQDPDDVISVDAPPRLTRTEKVPTANKLVAQAELLRAAGFPRSAAKVLDWTLREASPAEAEFRFYLAELKADVADTHASLLTLSKILVDFPHITSRKALSLYFPRAFYPLFEKNSEGLDPYLLLAIARQESAFDPRAVSQAKAKGLLQLLARKVRKKNLFDPETNIKAGARLFSTLLRQNGGHIHYALGGYNAGPMRVTAWVKRYTTVDPVLFTDLIPFKETRAYVALILRNYYWYRRLHAPNGPRLPWLASGSPEETMWNAALVAVDADASDAVESESAEREVGATTKPLP